MVNKIAKIGMLVWTILCFMGSCAGMMKVAQQTEGRELGGAESFRVGIGMFMWLLIWGVPMVVMGIVALVTRPNTPSVTAAAQPRFQMNDGALCPHCGKYYAGTARFCPLCGMSQSSDTSAARSAVALPPNEPSPVSFCPSCGGSVGLGAKFCWKCAAPLTSASGQFTAQAGEKCLQISPSPSPAPTSSVLSPVSESNRELEAQRTPPQKLPASSAGFRGNNKGLLLGGAAVLALAAGGFTYWFVLRKPTVHSAPIASGPVLSQPATVAPNIPAAQTQPKVQPEQAPATEPPKAARENRGVASATPLPAKSGRTPPSAPPSDLSGNWRGEYTNHDTNQITKVNLQISEDRTDLLTGTLIFDPGGSNSGACPLTGAYNSRTKFMLLSVGTCRGSPPDYLQGKIGFSAVKPTDRQVFGVDSVHNCWLDISRQ